ncbi:hypothetical protein OR1_02757 [Geobacter sp. OR-1]|uniref:DUF262 domain-containing protein n=1 Tax=Geobacter sp. OR-1 TaxID=1266765 RepID=UPI000542D06F|nr:DUF262 domain-containing protein [Geobacter sp. OR-1]GAM10468.1 hypothetical protein OR1_02757 [Geobacter sp. OR-1]
MSTDNLKRAVVPVGKLLQYRQLRIPVYQRPYKWTAKNVQQLLNDIYTFRDKSAYRLGTVVIHDDHPHYDVVDGQQRLVTLQLLVRAIIKHHSHKVRSSEIKTILDDLNTNMVDFEFNNHISVTNIRQNYMVIERAVATFNEELIRFLLLKCEMIQFVLSEVSEAFQFFDAQNARGKELEPHDLLKAFHLREFSTKEEHLKSATVEAWEGMQTSDLSELFADFLFRVRSWSKLNSARFFTKNDTDLFKGVNLDTLGSFNYAVPLRISHHFVNNYNNNFERNIDNSKMEYPFQVDQPIINGRRFFEMVDHYKQVFDAYHKDNGKSYGLEGEGIGRRILDTLSSYEGRRRIGDSYVRMIFDCALLYYVDRFGCSDMNRAIEKIFIWAYKVRLGYKNVQLASVDNYVLETNIFRVIKDAITPDEFLAIDIAPIHSNESTNTEQIESLFKELKYYADVTPNTTT